MKKKKQSLADKILRVITKRPRAADEIRRELKDTLGYSETVEDVRVNLLYLLRREKIKRIKEDSIFKYHI